MSTLAVGQNLSQKYADLLGGFHEVSLPCDPAQAIMIIAGASGCGKSTFIRSCKHAFIFNVDGSSADTKVKGRIWPGVREDGTLITANPQCPSDPSKGIPLGGPLTWKMILDKTEILVNMAKENVPGRPRLIVLDTLDNAYPLMQDYVLEEYNRRASPGQEKRTFADIHGKLAYPRLYEVCRDWVQTLRGVGYGVCLLLHLRDKIIYLSDDRKELKTDTWRLPENFIMELETLCEVIGCVEKDINVSVEDVPLVDAKGNPMIGPNGQPRITKQKVERTSVWLTFESAKLAGITKKRSEYPSRLLLPREGAWDTFEQIHQKFLESIKKEQ